MAASGGSWHTQAMLWPLISGAAYGIYVAWQFAAPDFASRLLGSFLGALCSLPAGASLGGVAILAGHTALPFAPQRPADRRLIGWRLVFGATTAVAVTLPTAGVLAWIGSGSWALSACGTVAAIAFAAAYAYFPESELRTASEPTSPAG